MPNILREKININVSNGKKFGIYLIKIKKKTEI